MKDFEMTYNESLYQKDSLKYWATNYLRCMPKRTKLILSQGSSGAALASAMIVLSNDSDLRNIYVPKGKREKRHAEDSRGMATSPGGIGYNVNLLSKPFGYRYKTCIIVDDFTDSGKTIMRMVNFAIGLELKVRAILVESMNNPSRARLEGLNVIEVKNHVHPVPKYDRR